MRRILRGDVREGQFPTERTVVITDHEGRSIGVIVAESYVVDGGLEVEIVDETDELLLVRLPGEVLTSGRVVTVRRDQVLEGVV